jgi:hypothetical protein
MSSKQASCQTLMDRCNDKGSDMRIAVIDNIQKVS